MGPRSGYCNESRSNIGGTARRLRTTFSGGFALSEHGSERFPDVTMRPDEVTVGCTTVTRQAVQMMYELFQKHYPNGGAPQEVKIQ